MRTSCLGQQRQWEATSWFLLLCLVMEKEETHSAQADVGPTGAGEMAFSLTPEARKLVVLFHQMLLLHLFQRSLIKQYDSQHWVQKGNDFPPTRE